MVGEGCVVPVDRLLENEMKRKELALDFMNIYTLELLSLRIVVANIGC